jgi:predicted glycosyltransferase
MANVLFDIGHPAHVHLFRNIARRLEAQGHRILFSALDREMIIYLLDYYQLPYQITWKRGKGKRSLVTELAMRTWVTFRIARQFRADLMMSMGSPTVGIPALLLRKPYLAVTDTDHATEQHALFKPFATVIATPTVFKPDFGSKQIRYRAYHELAYLHPDEFTPDENVLRSLGIQPGETYFVVRFVSWSATHDIGKRGFTPNEKKELLQELSQQGRVLLSVEGDIDPEFAHYQVHFPREIIHHLLAFASMYIGEGGTMLSEAAVLGTPAIFVNPLRAGYWTDLQDNYHLAYLFDTGVEALPKIRELLATPNLKKVWGERRAHLLEDKIDPTPWFVQLINQMLNDPKHVSDEGRHAHEPFAQS